MRTFRVEATMITSLYLDVQAEDEDEALRIAADTDGGEFIDRGGDWQLGDVYP